MTGNEYQRLAMRTTKDEWRGNMLWDQKIHAVTGLNSEAGEVAGMIQKMYQGHSMDIPHLIKELGDTMWFIAECCDAWGISLDEVMETNIDKLKSRYPEGFEVEKSLHRKEGDI